LNHFWNKRAIIKTVILYILAQKKRKPHGQFPPASFGSAISCPLLRYSVSLYCLAITVQKRTCKFRRQDIVTLRYLACRTMNHRPGIAKAQIINMVLFPAQMAAADLLVSMTLIVFCRQNCQFHAGAMGH
jgi:hypothetical protein